MFPHGLIAVAAFLSCLKVTWAGPGAVAYGCVDLATKPGNNYTVNFSPINGGNKCMNSIGSTASVLVSVSGSTCASLGYVEAKTSSSGGDLCATDESIWHISFETSGREPKKSGDITTRWRKQWGSNTNEISFYDHVDRAKVCGSDKWCNSEKFYWDTGTQPNVYFIFQPDRQVALVKVGDDTEQVPIFVDHIEDM